jgi:3-hydroxyethyl bacteriochlorophyllide a dehydrogenase
VLVTGGGLIGQFAAQLARARGAYVILSEPSPQRAALARAHSADEVIDPTAVDIVEALSSRTKEGPDTVIETSGISEFFEKAIEWVRPGGQLLMQGWYAKPVTFDFHPVHIKKPHVSFACGFGDMALAVDLIVRGRVNVADLITRRLAPQEMPETYARLAAGDASDLGMIIDWSKL